MLRLQVTSNLEEMLIQEEADRYIEEQKAFPNPIRIKAGYGSDSAYKLVGKISGEEFIFDVWRKSVRISKTTLQNRVMSVHTLVRLDLDAAPHTNPDGEKISEAHIHIYKEGYNDRWAYRLSDYGDFDTSSTRQLIYDFCAYCNMDTTNISIQEGLL